MTSFWHASVNQGQIQKCGRTLVYMCSIVISAGSPFDLSMSIQVKFRSVAVASIHEFNSNICWKSIRNISDLEFDLSNLLRLIQQYSWNPQIWFPNSDALKGNTWFNLLLSELWDKLEIWVYSNLTLQEHSKLNSMVQLDFPYKNKLYYDVTVTISISCTI